MALIYLKMIYSEYITFIHKILDIISVSMLEKL